MVFYHSAYNMLNKKKGHPCWGVLLRLGSHFLNIRGGDIIIPGNLAAFAVMVFYHSAYNMLNNSNWEA